jgi:hypothetical protein
VAASIALGLELGFLATPFSIYWPHDAAQALQVLLWLAAVAGASWLCLVYARFFGQRVFGAHYGQRSPTWKRRFLTLALTALLGAFYLPLMAWRVLYINARDPENVGALERLIPTALGAALAAYLAGFGVTWALMRLRRAVRPLRCPICAESIRQRVGVGRYCVHCGHRLAPWLFVQPSALRATEHECIVHAQSPRGC